MKLKHKSLFHTVSEAEFSRAVENLDADIPTLDGDQILVRLAQIGALIQDGHSGLSLRSLPPELEERIPVRFVQYAGGIYVRAAAPEYADAVGGKVVGVGTYGWQDAMQKINSIVSHDPGNFGEQLAWGAKLYLNCPVLLHGFGLSESNKSAEFVIEKNGQRRTIAMTASVPLGTWYLNAVPPEWVDARPKSVPAPLSIQRENEFYWFTYLPEDHAVYFQFNVVANDERETLADFAERLAAFIEGHDLDRLVIDLRNNTGGDNTLLRPLLVALIRSKVNRRGGMYVLIGPTTFSAAQNFVNRLENYTEAIFVGEPTSENVNFYGDAAGIELPHSHLKAGVSQLWWQDKDPRDLRTCTAPEIAATTSFADYVKGSDPVLQLTLSTPTPPSLEDALERALPGGADSVLAGYNKFVNDPAHKYLPDCEPRVNTLGYKFLSAKRVADALLIFELNIRTNPNSANAYDSMGEAYAAAKDNRHAIEAYRRSLQLNPKNSNAKVMIDKLERTK